jgi:glycosyltransferase involved in cell wall biosynthesis
MSEAPVAVFGLTAYNGDRHLAEALESLLDQTRPDLAVLVVDDCSRDGTADVALRYADLDPRVTYVRNERQLGLVCNWRRALELAAERFPGTPYFAWASDHDVWHRLWLEHLAGELERHPEAVLSYPLTVRIDDAGAEYPTRDRLFETAGVADPVERLRRAGGKLAAGEMIYGLFRRDALERRGPFPLAVLPDRLQLLMLAAEGEFRQVPRRLWFRRYRAGVAMSNRRQREASFPDGVPLRAYVPWWVSHPVLFGRVTRSPRLGAVVLAGSVGQAWRRSRERDRRRRRWNRRDRRRRIRAFARRILGGAAPLPAPAAPAAAPDAPKLDLGVLERAELLGGLDRPGVVVVDLGGAAAIAERLPRAVVVTARDQRDLPERADLALGVGAIGRLGTAEAERRIRRLHEIETPVLYVLDRDGDELRNLLARWYWLRDLWVPGVSGSRRKPDPAAGPVTVEPGCARHLAGRRRLLTRE